MSVRGESFFEENPLEEKPIRHEHVYALHLSFARVFACRLQTFLLEKITENTIQNWKSFEERKHFTMLGNFMHAPNVDAVLQLKNALWKNIRKQLPTAELHIYGAYPTQQILRC